MSVKVKGVSYRPVQLMELRDAVFYGQTKVFSDQQRAASPSLQAAIDAGLLVVLEETSLPAPLRPSREFKPLVPPVLTPAEPAPVPKEGQASSPVDMESLVGKVTEAVGARIEEALQVLQKAQPATTVAPAPVVEAPAQKAPSDATAEALTALARKIDGLVVSGAGVTSQTTLDGHRAQTVDDVYIPSIKVDDMANHIQLESRSLGQGGQVNAALAALRNLKKS